MPVMDEAAAWVKKLERPGARIGPRFARGEVRRRAMAYLQGCWHYGCEEQCRPVVEKLRWPSGFICPTCGGCEGTRLRTRPKIQCRACRHQVSLTVGTIFHTTKLPLTSWFLVMWLIATAKNGISSVELGRRLRVKQTNALSLKQKIMAVMAEREDRKRLRVGSRWMMSISAGTGPADAVVLPPASSPSWRSCQPVMTAARARSSSCRSKASTRGRSRSL